MHHCVFSSGPSFGASSGASSGASFSASFIASAALALSALAGLATQPARAAPVVYTSQASYEAALGRAVAADGFGDLAAGAALAGPLDRAAGGVGYRARAVPVVSDLGAEDFFPVAPGGNTALSSNFANASLVFDRFSQPLRGVGGSFFATSEAGDFIAGMLTLLLVDGDGTASFTLNSPGAPSFLGFVSNSAITSLTLSAVQPPGGFSYAALDNLSLAAAAAVPEPHTLTLVLLGLAAAAAARPRSRHRRIEAE